MELLFDYLMEEALILIPVLLIIGKIVKATPFINNWLIPHIILIIGLTLTFYMLGINMDAFIQGVLISGAAVFSNQIFKQTKGRG